MKTYSNNTTETEKEVIETPTKEKEKDPYSVPTPLIQPERKA